MHIIRRRGWEIPESRATPQEAFFNRRRFLLATGLASAAGLAPVPGRAEGLFDRLFGETEPPTAPEGPDPTADLYPAPRNEAYKVSRPVTSVDITGRYNNFYEYGSQKQIWKGAQGLKIRPWDIRIDGLVEKEMTISFDDLVRKMPLEERVVRHRCVEAWSMIVPWTGFPLSALISMARPLGSAKYVRFETFLDPAMASGQKQSWYPWPYIEGLTMAEAGNELAFLVTGAYGKPLAKQFGAPLRLHVPWKYGFKSIKSIVRVSFTEERPLGFWEEIQGNEYGFWANVNPKVPHPRWSQASERDIGTGEILPTRIYNGYGEYVAHLYDGLEGEKLFM